MLLRIKNDRKQDSESVADDNKYSDRENVTVTSSFTTTGASIV